MNYSETLEYLFSRLPMFHRIGAAAYKPDLNNIIALTDRLNNPERNFRSIHIAGTNGKGSTSHMLASVLQQSGYKTGLFTSPHLKDFRERIRINGNMIDEKTVIDFVEKYKHVFEDVNPSFFEWTTLLAFKYFADEKVDVAVIETGLGGRLDSTNIINPELSVITNISFDHMYLLGDTLEKIAGEKAGIIKSNIPVVVGEKQKETEDVFINRAIEMNAPTLFASEKYKAEFVSASGDEQKFMIHKNGEMVYEKLSIDLSGNYQVKNICTVLQSLDLLKKIFSEINERNIISGLKNSRKNTGLQGRWQIINKKPLTIVDVGHNEAGIKFVVEQLSSILRKRQTPNARLRIVFGMVNDKTPSTILSLLPVDAEYYFCKADIPRALDANELRNAAAEYNLKGESYKSVIEALNAAQKNAGENDLIFVGGSTFVVAEVI